VEERHIKVDDCNMDPNISHLDDLFAFVVECIYVSKCYKLHIILKRNIVATLLHSFAQACHSETQVMHTLHWKMLKDLEVTLGQDGSDACCLHGLYLHGLHECPKISECFARRTNQTGRK